MKMIILTQCCCGCSVRTGSLVIAVLFAILSLTEFVVEQIQLNSGAPSNQPHYVPLPFVTVEAVANFLAVIANILLLFGTLTERIIFIFVWIIYYTTYALFILVSMVTSLVVLPAHISVWVVPFYLTGWGVTMYSVLVVNTHYRNLRDGVSLAPRQPVVLIV